jgi:hypothetical protein
MTNIYLQKAVPVSISERAGDLFSAVVLVLSGVLALVTLATV